jgi:hypothetical protein
MESENESFLNKKEQIDNKDEQLSIYGKEKFPPQDAKMHIDGIVNNFKEHFSSHDYKEQKPVLISSGFDPSVRFIGSPVSVFKPYIVDGQIPRPGIFMRQDCVRTKNVDRLLDDNYSPDWGSYFPNMGAITPPERSEEASNETFDFFEKKLGISPENIKIRINSADKDLMDICKNRYSEDNLEIDSKEIEYYRHKLGVEELLGRNCNIALRNSDGKGFSDVANLIIIEKNGKPVCLEISIGTTTILKELHGLDHVQDGVPIEGLQSVDKKIRRKFEDAIVTSSVLFNEGLRPFGQHNRNRILKKYVQSLSYFRSKSNMSIEDLKKVIVGFEEREFPEAEEQISDTLIDIITAYENELLSKKNLNEDQYKIKQALLLK